MKKEERPSMDDGTVQHALLRLELMEHRLGQTLRDLDGLSQPAAGKKGQPEALLASLRNLLHQATGEIHYLRGRLESLRLLSGGL